MIKFRKIPCVRLGVVEIGFLKNQLGIKYNNYFVNREELVVREIQCVNKTSKIRRGWY